jgi:hypothetical protein
MFGLVSCEKIKKHTKQIISGSEDPLIELNGEALFLSDIEKMLPKDLSAGDSTLYVNNYIKKWVTRNLVYEKANKNVDNIDEIELLVNDYRKSLVIHNYQQKLIEQKVKKPSEREIKQYYDNNTDIFKLKENLIKGLFMKLPKNASKVDVLKTWIARPKSENLQEIEKYSYQNAISYTYFGDKWMSFTEFLKMMPVTADANVNELLHQKLIEMEDNGYIYLLAIYEFRVAGSTEPYEYAKDKISAILLNKSKEEYINTFEDELYQKAIKDGIIKN